MSHRTKNEFIVEKDPIYSSEVRLEETLQLRSEVDEDPKSQSSTIDVDRDPMWRSQWYI